MIISKQSHERKRAVKIIMAKKEKIESKDKITIEQYLEKLARFSDSEYGKMIRNQFKDIQGGSELAMLAAPNTEELEQLKKAVAIMTPGEKKEADSLTDEQIQKIAADADIDAGIFAIFINGLALHCKRVS